MTSRTPGSTSMSLGSIGLVGTPTAPRTVKSTPLERWTSYATSTSASMTFWMFSSLAVCSITMTMDILSLPGFRRRSGQSGGTPVSGSTLPRLCSPRGSRSPSAPRPGNAPWKAWSFPGLPGVPAQIDPRFARVVHLAGEPLQAAALVDDALEHPPHRTASRGPGLFRSTRSRIHFSRSGW